jgi:hypothetical protein
MEENGLNVCIRTRKLTKLKKWDLSKGRRHIKKAYCRKKAYCITVSQAISESKSLSKREIRVLFYYRTFVVIGMYSD